jgi:hypothetical protein
MLGYRHLTFLTLFLKLIILLKAKTTTMTEQATPVISPQETEAEKLRLIKLLKKELLIHGLVDATGYVNEHTIVDRSHTHSGFVRSLVFKMEKEGVVEVIPVEEWQRFYIKELTWDKKHPFLHAMRISFANSFLYVIAGVAVALIGSKLMKSRTEERLDKQAKSIERIESSMNRFQNELTGVKDSLTKLRER